jgi:hypothetical protein
MMFTRKSKRKAKGDEKICSMDFEARAWEIVCCEIDGADVELLEGKIFEVQNE